MTILLAIGAAAALAYMLIQFARQEVIEDAFAESIRDIEARLDWAKTRRHCPFGMSAQLNIAGKQLDEAKRLWEQHCWQRAYTVVRQAEAAMDKAQQIYSATLTHPMRALNNATASECAQPTSVRAIYPNAQ